ncbi:MAG: DUF4097 family beta strand repeat protein [Planctomycetaceae bacterium]|nr:DUF4097 family beta strand repeat protein [Planctomycetaceae bacterium]
MGTTTRSLLLLGALLAGACRSDSTVQVGPGGNRYRADAEREERFDLDLGAGDRLLLRGDQAWIRVESTRDGPGHVVARLTAAGRTDEEAAAVLARYRIEFAASDAGADVRVVGEPFEVPGKGGEKLIPRVEFTAFVPPGTALDARTGLGDIEASGDLGTTELHTDFGTVITSGIRGSLRANSGSGSVEAVDVEGPSLALSSQFGGVYIARGRAESISARSGSGAVVAEDLVATSIELTTGFGSIRAAGIAGALELGTGSGELSLEGFEGDLAAKSQFGSLSLEGVFTGLHADSGAGSVHVRALPGSRVGSEWRISSDFGEVRVGVPKDLGAELEASTNFGQVRCNVGLMTPATDRDHLTSVRGRLGQGGGTLAISSGSGNVTVEALRP